MNPFAPRQYGRLEKITERVYLFRHIVNSVVVLGDEATMVVDTQVNAAMAARLLRQIHTLTDRPLRYALNTHYHWDHTAGNDVFKQAGATVLSSVKTRQYMQTRYTRQQAFLASRGFELGPAPSLADETLVTGQELNLGNQRLHVLHLGPAETDDAMVIHLPQENCVIAGDTVMTGSFPIFGQPVMNEGLMGTTAWLEAIARIERLRPQYIIPGHGPVAYHEEIQLLKRLESYFLHEVAARVARHMPLPQLLDDLERQLPDWITAIPVVWGTPRYAILRVYRGLVDDPRDEPGWQHYKPSAIPEAPDAQVEATCAPLTALADFHAVAAEYEEGGDIGCAIAVARRATECLPTLPAAWVLLADCLVRGARCVTSVLEKGDFFAAARQALQQALQLDSHYLPAHLSYGRMLVMRAYRNGGDPEPGVMHLRRIIDAAPGPEVDPALLASAHFYLGMAHRTRGDERQAAVHFTMALNYVPTFQPALLAQKV